MCVCEELDRLLIGIIRLRFGREVGSRGPRGLLVVGSRRPVVPSAHTHTRAHTHTHTHVHVPTVPCTATFRCPLGKANRVRLRAVRDSPYVYVCVCPTKIQRGWHGQGSLVQKRVASIHRGPLSHLCLPCCTCAMSRCVCCICVLLAGISGCCGVLGVCGCVCMGVGARE